MIKLSDLHHIDEKYLHVNSTSVVKLSGNSDTETFRAVNSDAKIHFFQFVEVNGLTTLDGEAIGSATVVPFV